ncbi:MAG: cysteine desulfurase family protein [Candidatus Aenigmatarchaeota archaeon]
MDAVYADNNASTPVDPRVVEAMEPYFRDEFANPNSLYGRAQNARKAVQKARKQVAKLLNGKREEIVFTSCATESNNYAIKGTAFARQDEGKHIITSKVEHKCVMNACRWLEKQGFDVTYLDVDEEGCVSLDDLEEELRDDTILVSIMMANNEIGTIEPIQGMAKIVHENSDAYFHTDAAQIPGKMKLDVGELGVDMATINAHKMYGPKGIGALWIKNGLKIDPLLHGGGQEKGRRSGTENVPYIVGLGEASEIARKEWKKDKKRLEKMTKRLVEGIESNIDNVILNGPREDRLPGNVNFSFPGVEGEALVLRLDGKGIEVATGSACGSETLEASHVLQAIGLEGGVAHSSLRISFGRFNTMEDVEKIIEELPEIVQDLRSITAMDDIDDCF